MQNKFKAAKNILAQTSKTIVSRITNQPQKIYGIFFEVTDACNSRCRHCNIWQQKPTADLLTPKEIEKIFRNPYFSGLQEIIISGGEALLRPDLEEVILIMHRYAKPNAFFSLSTNGLMPERALKATQTLVESGVNTIVGVSLDGIGENHDEVRGVKGNFERVDRLFHELKKMQNRYKDNLNVTVGFTLSPLTVNSMKDVEAYSEKLGFLFLPQVYEEAPFYINEGNVDSVGKEAMIKAIEELPFSLQKEIMLKAAKGEQIKFKCSSMETFFVLHCNGDVSPCLYWSNMRLGNLREKPIDEILQSQAVKDAREKTISGCSRCYNTWGTGWSMKAWCPPLINFLLRSTVEESLKSLKKS